MKNIKIKFLIALLMCISIINYIFCPNAECNETQTIKFQDKNLYSAIVSELKEYIKSENDKECTIEIENIDQIVKLDLSNRNISDIAGIDQFVKLKELNLRSNAISNILPLNSLTDLTTLDISKNKLDDNVIKINGEISDIPRDTDITILDNLSNLVNLEKLDISHNCLRYTKGLDKFTKLTELNLYDNKIHDLHGFNGIKDNNTIKKLNLGQNNEIVIGQTKNFVYTDLEVSYINNLTSLEELDFSENRTPNIIKNIDKLTNLKILQLEGNNIEEENYQDNILSNIADLTNLEKINLYNNKIKNIEPLTSLTDLKELIISKNQIEKIPEIYDNGEQIVWKNLSKLDIHDNKIVENEAIKKLCEKSNKEEFELNYEKIVDTSKLPHYDENGIAYVTYNDFGARCNGIYDDFIAIKNAHIFANNNNCEVRASNEKEYHIFKYYDEPVYVKTNVNWNNATFVVHDEQIETVSGRFSNIFIVNNIISDDIKSINIEGNEIGKNTTKISNETIINELKRLNAKGYIKYLCQVENPNKKQYIRYGNASNSGVIQQDYFLIDGNGNVLNDIQWDFEAPETNPEDIKFTIYPIPNTELTIQNGNFITNALGIQGETTYVKTSYNKNIYYDRNIYINQSANVNVLNINHTLGKNNADKDNLSGSYRGFIYTDVCADITLSKINLLSRKNCLTSRSTYDLNISKTVNLVCNEITSNDIADENRWGVTATYYSKDVTFNNCKLNRIDAHEGIYNLNVNDSLLGVHGLTLTGQGTLNLKNTKVEAPIFISLRKDYGSTWNGDINIDKCTYKYTGATDKNPILVDYDFTFDEDSGKAHDFGYECKLPNLYIKDLLIDDSDNKINYDVLIMRNNTKNVGEQINESSGGSYWPQYIIIDEYNTSNTDKDIKMDISTRDLKYLKDKVIAVQDTKVLSYQVEYYKDGIKVEDDKQIAKKTLPDSNQNTLKVDKTTINLVNKYTGYKLDTELTANIPNIVNDGDVIKVYYAKDDTKTNKLQYTVNHIKATVGEEETIKTETTEEDVYVLDEQKITIKAGTLATLSKETDEALLGYKLDETRLPQEHEGDKVENGKVINFYYIKDESQTKELKYTVRYYKDNVEVSEDKIEQKETVWIRAEEKLKVKNVDKSEDKYKGYKFKQTDPVVIPEKINNGDEIKVYYVKDNFDYTVEYYYDGNIDSSETETAKAEFGSVITKENIQTKIESNVKTGYRFEKTENLPLTVSENAENNVIKVYYIIDDGNTKTLSYTVEYYKDNVKVEEDTQTVSKTVQILKADTLTVDKFEINVTNKYVGYKLEKLGQKVDASDETTITDIPETVETKTIIKVYYVIDESQTKDLSYTVEYYKDGVKVDTETESKTVQILQSNALAVAKEKINMTDKYVGYHFVKTEPAAIPETVNNGAVIKVYYEKDEEKPEEIKTKSEGVIVKYYDNITNNLLEPETLYKGYVGDSYNTSAKEFEGYDIVKEKMPENEQGKMTKEEVEVNYYYIRKMEVEAKHIDKKTGKEIAQSVQIKGHEGDDYKTLRKDIKYYKFIEDTKNTEGKMKSEVIKNEDGTERINTKVTVNYYYEPLKFNLKVTNNIEAITKDETKRKTEDKKLGKVEIHRNNIDKTNVKVELKIRVTNNGELDGKAILMQKIPDGFIMNQEENKDWIIKEGMAKIEIEDIKVGETKEYKVVLEWAKGENNLGIKECRTYIVNAVNDADFAEETKKDNTDKVAVIMSVETGNQDIMQYIVGTITCSVLILAVVVLRKRKY